MVDNHDVLPTPSQLWEEALEEDRRKLAEKANYRGRGSPPGTQIEDPPAEFVERNFSDLIAAEPARPATEPPIREPSLVVNLPDVKDDIILIPVIDWAAEARAQRQK